MGSQQRHPEWLDDQREFFDELVTEDWDTYEVAEPVWAKTRRFEIDQMLHHAGMVKTVLDVGCGSGRHDVEMAERPGVERVVGVDYSPRSIEAAEREFPHRAVERHVADIFTMQPGQFDLVFSICVLPHLANPAEFLAACRRQVSDGGVVVATTPNRDRLENRLRRAIGKPDALIDPQHFAEYTPAELAEFGCQAGLRMTATFAYDLHINTPWFSFAPWRQQQVGHRTPRLATRFGAVYVAR
jgi:SAM-dependent methyltransferase